MRNIPSVMVAVIGLAENERVWRRPPRLLLPYPHTMGNSSSTLDSNGPSPPSKALHVLRVSPGSPAAQTDIDPFFDFVVGIDNDERGSVCIIFV